MRISTKLWHVQGKDLQEVQCEALKDEQRLVDWLIKGARNHTESALMVVNHKPDAAIRVNKHSQHRSASPQSSAIAFQETKTQAERGDAAAQAALGFMYELGMDAPVDRGEAVKWYRKAAEQGNTRAQLNLAQIAALGFMRGPGVEGHANAAEAVEWHRKEADDGNARAQFNLGQMYEWGNGVPQGFAEAVKWYRKAAEQGEAAAQYKLGLCYCNGQGVPQSTALAVKWWVNAAEQGEAAAQYKLGLCYCNGQGVKQDYGQAVKWYRQAAEQGDAMAQGKLGDAYYIGVGVAISHEEAFKWYREAAEQGEATAQRHLGIMYGLGQGVPQDNIEAYKWYTLAAAQHDTSAIRGRDTLSSSLTPAQITEGQRLSQEFIARKNGGASYRGNGQDAVLAGPLVEDQRVNPPQPFEAPGGKAILGFDVLLIGRQVKTANCGRIDLLAIDDHANILVLELQRDKTPNEIMAQTLDHAAWVKDLTYEQIEIITKDFAGKPLPQAFSDHFGLPLPQTVNARHSMVILASELDDSSERVVRYLATQHHVPMHVLFVALFKTASGEFLGSEWLNQYDAPQKQNGRPVFAKVLSQRFSVQL
jgi:TPR repeat protein